MENLTKPARLAKLGNAILREAMKLHLKVSRQPEITSVGLGFWKVDKTWCTAEVKDEFVQYLENSR